MNPPDSNKMDADKTKMAKANFMQVLFQNIGELYHVDTNVECAYIISRFLEVGSRDWIGLYKVGWRSPTDYIYYEWAPVPQNYVAGKEVENKVVFPAAKLPKDDGEFYQFCYVTSSGDVRGASAPFQFKQPSLDDLIEIEDENGELLVVRTKTAVLEDQLKKANEMRIQLKQKIQLLENERDLLVFTERDVGKKLQRKKEENELLQEKLTCMAEMVTDLHHEADDLQACSKALQEKIEFLNQEKSSMEKRLDDNDAYIVSLQEKIKSLVTEKDALVGRTKVLEEEREMFKNHFSSSECNLQSYHKECERLRTRLSEADGCTAALRRDLERLENDLDEQNYNLGQQLIVQRADKENIEDLSERLHNAEDKLSAAEHCKMMFNDEVITLRLAYEKMSADLEQSNSEVDALKSQLIQLETRLMTERDEAACELEVAKSQIAERVEAGAAMSVEMDGLRRKVEDQLIQARSEENGPMYALQMAQITLKERYGKMTKKNEGLQKSLEMAHQRLQQLEEIQTEQKGEIETLTKRLDLGKDAYQEKFIECERLQTELARIQPKPEVPPRCREVGRGSKASTGLSTKRVPELPQKSVELQTSLDVLSTSEMQLQLDDVLKELTSCRARTRQQDAVLAELSMRCEAKTYEVTDLTNRNKSLVADYDMKMKWKDAEIELMKKQLRESAANKPTPGEPGRGAVGQCTEITPQVIPMFYDSDAIKKFDPLATDDTQKSLLSPALRPLPPPMQPEILPSAKVAQLKAAINYGNHQMFNSMDQFSPDIIDGPDVIPAGTVVDDEKFEDAPGVPQMSCPVCEMVFLHDAGIPEMTQHIDSHYGSICPMCNEQFPSGYPIDQFTVHVDTHFK